MPGIYCTKMPAALLPILRIFILMNSVRHKKRFLVIIYFLATCFAVQSQDEFEKGKLLDRIAVTNTKNENFALYLPNTYNPQELTKILFIFDPSGNGAQGVNAFINAAEKHNFMLVSSNNSRNGPYELNFGIANRLLNHVFSTFNIDAKGIYLAGFSGGARLATAIACLMDQVSGVIACGAGFSGLPAHAPTTQNFAYAGLIGNEDMNYTEMRDVKAYLQKLRFNHTLISFNGGHQWPPSTEIEKAFQWLLIQSHKKGTSKLKEEQLYEFYKANFKSAKKALKENHSLLVEEEYERLLHTFGSIFKTDSISDQLKQLKKSKAHKQEIKQLQKALLKEKVYAKKYADRFHNDFEHAKNAKLDWWEKEINALKKAEIKSNKQMSKMIKRVRFQIFVMAFSSKNATTYQVTLAQKDFCNALGKLAAK